MSISNYQFPSPYPDKGLTIFSVMSALAQKHKAINLSQGFPDYEIDEPLKAHLDKATHNGYNQYAPMGGWPALQQAIANKVSHFQNVHVNPNNEITITPGATYAIYTALKAIIQPGDEVIVLEPAYDSYVPNIYMHGGVPKCVPLNPETFRVDWDVVKSAITKNTRAIIINNPHNPCGTVWSNDEMLELESICTKHNLYLISDEVYEHIVFDGHIHLSALRYSKLRERTFVIGSFGKIFHNTGWKVGYCIAPESMTQAFRRIHQYIAFSVNTPAQVALAAFLSEDVTRLSDYGALLQKKRDYFLQLMSDTPFICPFPSQGSYFQLMDYGQISQEPDKSFAIWLTEHVGVATIPVSSFYDKELGQRTLLRFCFAKQNDTILSAALAFNSIKSSK